MKKIVVIFDDRVSVCLC